MALPPETARMLSALEAFLDAHHFLATSAASVAIITWLLTTILFWYCFFSVIYIYIYTCTTTKIENHDTLILGAFKKYHYIWIYNGASIKASLFDVDFISITGYTMVLYGNVIVMVF